MNIKLSSSKFYSFLLAIMFYIGIQSTIEAQIRVVNGTGCTITVFVGQNDLSTAVPCDLCPINPPTAVSIAPGAFQDIFGQDICGEEAGWIAWTIAGVPGFGISPNPGLLAVCVPNVSGPVCPFLPTNAFWSGGGGTGFVKVLIF